MEKLINDPSLIIMSAVGLFFLSGIVYSIFNSLNELDKFRANLKPGTRVKVKHEQEVFVALIVRGHNKGEKVVKNLDSKELYVIPINKIYKP